MSVTAMALAGACGMAACSGHIADNTPASNGTNFVAGDGTATYYQPGHRTAAPGVSGTTLSGSKLSVSSYRGHVVVLNFWGSWCAPCRKEAPTLVVLSQQYRPKGVRFVGVDIRDQTSAAQAFVQNFSIGYPSLNDPSDQVALEFRGAASAAAIPSTLVIDQNGRIAGRVIGTVSNGSLNTILSKLTAGT
ncbi:MAG TPA: TlpA disulfide reductase family protein [Streptosporangiaceae bacterium]|nr:TlpA disulfide reductase family protein [Streptosporangiaceae bacterium]